MQTPRWAPFFKGLQRGVRFVRFSWLILRFAPA